MDAMELVVIPLVLALMMAVKQMPWFAPDPEPDGPRRNGWVLAWIAAALGVGGVFLYGQAAGTPGNWALCVLRGIGYGFAAVGLWDGGINKVAKALRPPALVILLPLMVLFAGGCATAARHEYITQAVTDSLLHQDALATLGSEAEASARAKADQDQARLDKALMLDVETLAKQTFATDAERQAAILALVQKYRASALAITQDLEIAGDRQRRVLDLTDATREALAGILEIEARTWANGASRQELLDKAVVGRLLDLLKGTKP